ncbi:hypothetical protein HanIR_Chr02g0059321 [Helianthus annuus]|nr:hypothetical protein HanIR_Chr02g0059321 [Helianthus annuus]
MGHLNFDWLVCVYLKMISWNVKRKSWYEHLSFWAHDNEVFGLIARKWWWWSIGKR